MGTASACGSPAQVRSANGSNYAIVITGGGRDLNESHTGAGRSGLPRISRATRLRIVPHGEAIPIFSDLYCKDDKQLVEARGSVSREAIRMAIGQIHDYRRFAEVGTSLAILLPELPRPDLIELIKSAGITMIYRSDSGFITKPTP
jgi:hypothetical protein